MLRGSIRWPGLLPCFGLVLTGADRHILANKQIRSRFPIALVLVPTRELTGTIHVHIEPQPMYLAVCRCTNEDVLPCTGWVGVEARYVRALFGAAVSKNRWLMERVCTVHYVFAVQSKLKGCVVP